MANWSSRAVNRSQLFTSWAIALLRTSERFALGFSFRQYSCVTFPGILAPEPQRKAGCEEERKAGCEEERKAM
jgi:hypothetical protein